MENQLIKMDFEEKKGGSANIGSCKNGLPCRPCFSNHRGDSGKKVRVARITTGGKAPRPSIQRQPMLFGYE